MSHDSFIKTPKQLIWAVSLALLVPIFAIILLANYVSSESSIGPGTEAMKSESVAARIAPVAKFEIQPTAAGSAAPTAAASAQAASMSAAPSAAAPSSAAPSSAAPSSAAPNAGASPATSSPSAAAPPSTASPATAASAVAPAAGKSAPAAAATPPAAPVQVASAGGSTGEAPALFKQVCTACHTAGIAGAPKVGDKAAWAPRIATGLDAMTASVIKGKGAMPPKGGAASASDADIRAVVQYMVSQAK